MHYVAYEDLSSGYVVKLDDEVVEWHLLSAEFAVANCSFAANGALETGHFGFNEDGLATHFLGMPLTRDLKCVHCDNMIGIGEHATSCITCGGGEVYFPYSGMGRVRTTRVATQVRPAHLIYSHSNSKVVSVQGLEHTP